MYLAQKNNTIGWWSETEKNEFIIAQHISETDYEGYKFRIHKQFIIEYGSCDKDRFTTLCIEFEEIV